jgi:hypothetical protein
MILKNATDSYYTSLNIFDVAHYPDFIFETFLVENRFYIYVLVREGQSAIKDSS